MVIKKTCDCGCMILGPYTSKFVLSVLNPREVQNGTFNFKNQEPSLTRVISFVSQSSPSGVMSPYAKDQWSIAVKITWNKEFVSRVTIDVSGPICDLIQVFKVCPWTALQAIYAKTLAHHVICWWKTEMRAATICVVTHHFATSRNICKVG